MLVPLHLLITLIFKQIKDYQQFVTAAQAPYTLVQIVKAAENLVSATGKYSTTYCTWMAQPAPGKTYTNFKKKIIKEYQI